MRPADAARGIQALWLCPMASAHASSSCAAADVARALLLLSSAWRPVEILRPRASDYMPADLLSDSLLYQV
jgi:hypothetical protein